MGASAAVVALVIVSLCLGAQAQQSTKRGRVRVAESQSQFGLDMYMLMTEHDRTSNIFFSPMSIGTALAMAYAGSRGNTSKQMERVLHFQGRKWDTLRGHRGLLRWTQKRYKDGVTLRMTNRLYAAHRLRMRSKFSSYLDRVFQAEVSRLNFGRPRKAANAINERVRQDTEGNIESLIQPSMLDATTRLVMVNAIYFKGDWLMKFDKTATAPGEFHTQAGPKTVPMMRAKKAFAIGELYSLNARVLELPYKGENVNMMILLPNARDGIYQLERQLANTSLADLSWSTHADDKVEVRLPKFKLQERINLKAVLQQMGMTALFDAEEADMGGISRTEQLYVTDAVHKAAVEVNEEGTEASAATGLALGFRMLRPKPQPFVADRPFIFAIRDVKVGATLFLGRLMDPAPEQPIAGDEAGR